MSCFNINRLASKLFSEFQLKFTDTQNELLPLIETPFSFSAFEGQMQKKSNEYTSDKRKILSTYFQQQYTNQSVSEKTKEYLELISQSNTFTVSTGHQLSLFGGPAFFVYKIMHVIRLAEELKNAFPDQNFVPVFWMASEDHDFAEVNHLNLFNKKIEWAHSPSGAVGRMDTFGLDTVRHQLHELFQSNPEAEIHALIDSMKGKSYSDAIFQFVHSLFDAFGLLIIQPDNKALKRVFQSKMAQEIQAPFVSNEIEKANAILDERNWTKQIQGRPINLFYLSENQRLRIELNEENKSYSIGKKQFSLDEILNLLNSEPENFSPNVALRPVYQECILPNLCYVGGLGELSYWLQLKEVFQAAKVQFPLIQARTSYFTIDETSFTKWQELGFSQLQLFEKPNHLKSAFLEKNQVQPLEFNPIVEQFERLKSELNDLTKIVDDSLESFVGAEMTRMEKQVEVIRQRLEKSIKSRFDKQLKLIDTVHERLFPHNDWQERHFSFFHFSPDGNYTKRLNEIHKSCTPFSPEIKLLVY